MGRLVINGNEVYELDEECMQEKVKDETKNTWQCEDETEGKKKNSKHQFKLP